jgi:hypothetical protein
MEFLRGYDYYQGPGQCPAREYPLCSRARVVSFDRRYAAEEGSGNFLTLEYPLVRFAEQSGCAARDRPGSNAGDRTGNRLGGTG